MKGPRLLRAYRDRRHIRTRPSCPVPHQKMDATSSEAVDVEKACRKARQKDGKPVQAQPVVLAHFGPTTSPVCVSYHNWAQSIVGDIHRTLTHEFIERRSEHLSRLAAVERRQRSEAAGERQKVI